MPTKIGVESTQELAAMVNHKEIPPAGASDAVTDDMVERACAAFYSDLAWRTNSSQSRDFMRSALEAALASKADGGES